MSIDILSDEAHFIVVDKAPGVEVHDASGASRQPGLVTLIRRQTQDLQLFPVHRLDRDTSGLLLLGKGKSATRQLSQAFARRQVAKYYWALSDRAPRKKQGLIIGDMARARQGSWKLLRTRENPAITQFFSTGLGDGRRLFVLKPHTGKTHQLRVALKALGAPIIGDGRYGGAVASRLYLHAGVLEFELHAHIYQYQSLPGEGELFMDSAFKKGLENLGHPLALDWPVLKGRG